MSLAISVVQDDYIIASSDSAVTYFPYDVEKFIETGEYERIGDMIETDLKSQKVHKVSNHVLLLSVGVNLLTIAVQVELSHLVNRDDNLNDCREKAKTVMRNLREGKPNHPEEIKHKTGNDLKIEEPFEITAPMWKLLDDDIRFNGYLVGFSENVAGMVDIKDGTLMTVQGNRYPSLIVGEHPGYVKGQEGLTMYQKQLNLPLEHRTAQNYIDAMTLIHGQISYNHKNVSSDCTFYILQNDKNNTNYASFIRDTKPIHEGMEDVIKDRSQ